MPRFSMRPFKSAAYAFVPTLFRHHFFAEPISASRPRATAYLDGARGFAAVAVLNYHFYYAYSDLAEAPWDFQNPFSMPVIRLWFSAGGAIPIFFIFGGYSLAWKPLSQMSSGKEDASQAAMATLSSSAFRRLLRLYLPLAAITFIVASLIQLGAYEPTRSRLGASGPDLSRMREKHLEISSSFMQSILRWLWDILGATGFWDWKNYGPDHDKHLWTILSEFRCSIALYVTLLATARLRCRVRLAIIVLLSIHSMWWYRWDVTNFYWGVILAQLDIILDASAKRSRDAGGRSPTIIPELEKGQKSGPDRVDTQIIRRLGLSALFFFSLWCLSAPLWNWNTAWGYQTIASIVPSHYGARDKAVPALGVVLLQRCLYMSSADSRYTMLFTNSVALYLGKISFSLYLVHGPVLHSLGYNLPSLIWSIIGKETAFTYAFGIVVGWLIAVSLCLSAADVFHREIEMRCVSSADWIERKCMEP